MQSKVYIDARRGNSKWKLKREIELSLLSNSQHSYFQVSKILKPNSRLANDVTTNVQNLDMKYFVL
jgi:hypothetical protein